MPNTKPLTINQATLNDKLARAAKEIHFVNFGFFYPEPRQKPTLTCKQQLQLRHQDFFYGVDARRSAG
jgi:hypothetical protein